MLEIISVVNIKTAVTSFLFGSWHIWFSCDNSILCIISGHG